MAAGVRPLAGDGADIDDGGALADVDQRGQQRMSDVDQTRDVGVDHGVPVAPVYFLSGLRRQREAGVVEQRAHPRETFRQRGHGGINGVAVAHVEGDDMHRHLALQLFFQGFQAFETPPGEHQRPTCGGEAMRSGAAETGRRTGDEDTIRHESFLQLWK